MSTQILAFKDVDVHATSSSSAPSQIKDDQKVIAAYLGAEEEEVA